MWKSFQSASTENALWAFRLLASFYPTNGDDRLPEDMQDEIFIGCRMIAEMGADLVKTFYTGKRFSEVVVASPVPVLALGAKKLPKESDALHLAADAVNAGARGSFSAGM